MVRIDKLERALSRMSDKSLIRFAKRCVCKTLPGLGVSTREVRSALDMVFLECSRRGKERLYDMVYASISAHPERCDIR